MSPQPAAVQMRDNMPITSPWIAIGPCFGVRASWEVNRPGMLVFSVMQADVFSAGWGRHLQSIGALVKYAHPTARNWAGFVTAVEWRDGVYTFTAESYAAIMRKKLVKVPKTSNTAPGNVLMAALDKMNALQDLPFQINYNKNAKPGEAGYIDLTTRRISLTENPAVDVMDELIPSLTDDLNMEYRVDENRKILYAPFIGVDRTASVTLSVGQLSLTSDVQVVSATERSDLYANVNWLRGVGVQKVTSQKSAAAAGKTSAAQTGNKPQAVTKAAAAGSANYDFVTVVTDAVNAGARTAYGPLMERRDLPDDSSAWAAQLAAELDRIATPQREIELEVADLGVALTTFDEGDLVKFRTVASGNARVMSRALDVDRGVMTVVLRTVTGL